MDILRDPYDSPEAQTRSPETGEDAFTSPPARPRDERRMQVRAYNLWASLLNGRQFPAIDALNPEGDHGFGPRSVLLRLDTDSASDLPQARVVRIGEDLAREAGLASGAVDVEAIPPRSLLSRITDHYLQILANRAPIGFEAEFVNAAEATILYRGILLPFAAGDSRIDHIFGVINWKEQSATASTPDAAASPARTQTHAPQPRLPAAFADALPLTGFALTDWADGPEADAAGDFAMPSVGFGFAALAGSDPAAEPYPLPTAEPMGLADCLASARDLARVAIEGEQRSHRALYEALGQAHDFALASEDAPNDYAELLADAGISVQARAPLTALVKLVFGAEYDKTRVTEFAAVLAYARRLGLTQGSLACYLALQAGGIKAVVQAERAARRADSGAAAEAKAAAKADADTQLRETLSGVAARPLSTALDDHAGEFAVLLTRRLESGEIVVMGEASRDEDLLRRAAKLLTR
ncbi:hypothetical protein [Novosphingobium sp. 9]|uniref:hypothetical protein n=1 Tax=Novosphingobium sp. 9 TaxID=2025349 RepID=UPI0021B6C943|nr:hypothetical protein [Novosphingobium sp. 9]